MNATKHYMTNAHFSKTDSFRKTCQKYMETSPVSLDLDKIATRRRQASKYRRKTGVVYKTINGLLQ